MKTAERQAILKGANLMSQLESLDAVVDYCDIIALNDKHAASWTKGNNSGNSETLKQEEAKQDKIWKAANKIADKWGWKLDAPGLHWTITNSKGEEIR